MATCNIDFLKIAQVLSEVIGKPMSHVNWSEEQIAGRYANVGLNEGVAKWLAGLDTVISEGKEEIQNDVVEKVTGRKPKTFRKFAVEKKSVWQ